MRSPMLSACLALVLAPPVFGQEPAQSLTMIEALDEALSRNPDLIALRREYDAARAAPAQERHLDPPSFEAQIWAWPVTTLNPIRTDMYMLTVGQELPGRGKRASRALVGALAGPAIAECAGWSVSAADRHACCAGRGEPACAANTTNCCAMSEQSNDVTPTESIAARTPLRLLPADISPVAEWFLPRCTPVLTVSSVSRRAALVPLYLQQVSLLI